MDTNLRQTALKRVALMVLTSPPLALSQFITARRARLLPRLSRLSPSQASLCIEKLSRQLATDGHLRGQEEGDLAFAWTGSCSHLFVLLCVQPSVPVASPPLSSPTNPSPPQNIKLHLLSPCQPHELHTQTIHKPHTTLSEAQHSEPPSPIRAWTRSIPVRPSRLPERVLGAPASAQLGSATTKQPRSAKEHALTQGAAAVSRYRCKSELYAADLLLDVNSDVYPLEVMSRYTMRLSLTITTDVAMQKEEYDPVCPKPSPPPLLHPSGPNHQNRRCTSGTSEASPLAPAAFRSIGLVSVCRVSQKVLGMRPVVPAILPRLPWALLSHPSRRHASLPRVLHCLCMIVWHHACLPAPHRHQVTVSHSTTASAH